MDNEYECINKFAVEFIDSAFSLTTAFYFYCDPFLASNSVTN